MPAYSHSMLSTYENCPRQYKLKYVDRIEVPEAPEGIEAFLGQRVHETLAKLYQDLILSKLNSLEELLDHYSSGWDHNWHENVLVLRKGFEPEHYRKAGIEALTRYYHRYHPFDQSQTLATEHRTRLNLDGYTLRGVIDRLSHDGRGGYEIHDYKTSASLPSQEDLDKDRQLALYQIGIQESGGTVRALGGVVRSGSYETEKAHIGWGLRCQDDQSPVGVLRRGGEGERAPAEEA